MFVFQLPPCDADLVLQAVPAAQLVPPRLLEDVQSSGNKKRQGRQRTEGGAASGSQRPEGQTDEEADLEAAMMLSLAETSGSDGGPANIDSEQLARVMEMQRQGGWGAEAGREDEDMERALKMSLASSYQVETGAGDASEEDEIQRAIALSLEGGTGRGVIQAPASAGGQEGGWGARLRQQEMEEEKLYKEEQEKAVRQETEELEKALAMSMAPDNDIPRASSTEAAPKPSSTSNIDPVHTAWPKLKHPGQGTLAGNQPPPSSRAQMKPSAETKKPVTSQPIPGASSLIQTSIPENSDRPSLAKALMPDGEKN